MSKLSFINEKELENSHQSPRPKVRSPKWKFEDANWGECLDHNFFHRTFLGGLSLLFPEGERFFIRSVRQHQDKITDPQLLDDIKGFIGQEIQHGRLHELSNKKVLGKEFEIDGFLKAWTDFAFGKLEPFAKAVLPESIPVAVTAAAEHFTAIWGYTALTSETFQNMKNEQLRDLIKWHAIEEVEHKHVAFDVMRAVDDRYEIRVGALLLTAVLIGGLSAWATLYLALQEEDPNWMEFFTTLLKESTDEKGLVRVYVEGIFSYLRPGFHPADFDDYELAREVAVELEGRMKKYA